MENKFRKGVILGGILAVAAAVGFAFTPEGKKVSEDLQKDLKSLAKFLKKRLHDLEDVTKESFDSLVTSIVEEYAKDKKIADDAKHSLVVALQGKWHEMEKEYLDGKKEKS
jgi:gas vesicle protein